MGCAQIFNIDHHTLVHTNDEQYLVDVKSGKKNGRYVQYFPSTKIIKISCLYVQGVPHGDYTLYTIQSMPLRELQYYNGIKHGYCRFYCIKGQTTRLEIDAFYVDDKKHGLCWGLIDDEIYELSTYYNGEKHGYSIQWEYHENYKDKYKLAFLLSNNREYPTHGTTFVCYEYVRDKMVRKLPQANLEFRLNIIQSMIRSCYNWNTIPVLKFNTIGGLGTTESVLKNRLDESMSEQID
jgi:hypothetical protein